MDENARVRGNGGGIGDLDGRERKKVGRKPVFWDVRVGDNPEESDALDESEVERKDGVVMTEKKGEEFNVDGDLKQGWRVSHSGSYGYRDLNAETET
jgi:hypothetical protein